MEIKFGTPDSFVARLISKFDKHIQSRSFYHNQNIMCDLFTFSFVILLRVFVIILISRSSLQNLLIL